MKSWILGTLALILLVCGSLMAYPGKDGQHLAGLVLLIAGTYIASNLITRREDK